VTTVQQNGRVCSCGATCAQLTWKYVAAVNSKLFG